MARKKKAVNIGCPECGGSVAPGRWLCRDCEKDYQRLLRDVRPTMQALTSLTMKTARTTRRQGGGVGAFAPSPIDWGWERLRTTLAEWIRDTASHISPRYATVPLRQWRVLWDHLVANRSALLQCVEAPDDYRRLKRLERTVDHAMHPDEGMAFAGLCESCGSPIMCRLDMVEVECEACGTVNHTGRLRDKVKARLHGMHVTTTPQGAVRWLMDNLGIRVSRDTIRKRIKTGTLPAKPCGGGYYELSLGDLIDLADEHDHTNHKADTPGGGA